MHEVSRVFHDRLINDEDRDWFYEMIIELIGRYFKGGWDKSELFIENRILFSDILRLDSPNREYEEIVDHKKLLKVLDDKLDDYNMDENNSVKM